MEHKPNILVLCTGNSCRSQIAEGLLRHYASDRFNAYSAGTDPKQAVHPLAVQTMAEIGIDIGQQYPKDVTEYLGKMAVRYLIIVCDNANESCPRTFPGMMNRLFWPFDDAAHFVGTPEETLNEFRRVRDEIRQKIVDWLAEERAS
jgi:arsenate reductase